MAISLTTDGLNLDYRTTKQNTVSGTYPIGIVMSIRKNTTLQFPGTWIFLQVKTSSMMSGYFSVGSAIKNGYLAIRVE